MPKRTRSSSPPDARSKRRQPRHTGLLGLFDLDELFLRVLSYLEPADLARVQQVNKHWARMALDPQLWKRLYLDRYPHPHRSQILATPPRSYSPWSGASTPLRPIARLPSRAFPPPSPSPSPGPNGGPEEPVRHDGVDWKVMLRLGTNWTNGNVLTETRVQLPPTPSSESVADPPRSSEHHLALFPSFICAAHPFSPLVHVYTADSSPLGIIPPPPSWSSPSRPDYVAAIAADQAVAGSEDGQLPARLAIIYASGGFAVVRLRLVDNRLSWSRETVWNERTPPRRHRSSRSIVGEDTVVLVAFHNPYLLTCTRAFFLSVYMLGDKPRLLRNLHSDVAFHPATLSLSPAGDSFRASLAYCTPVYPTSWTVAVQELSISKYDVERGEVFRPFSSSDGRWPRRVEPLEGVRGRAVGIGSDGRWCVLAGEDAVIHVYALPAGKEGITHAQSLLAPTGGVSALALAGGRCVSGGGDGRVLVWELDDVSVTQDGEARVGSYVEVRAGGRRRKADEAEGSDEELEEGKEETSLPHPRAIASAARRAFLAIPPVTVRPAEIVEQHGETPIRQLAFDEQKIVGLVGEEGGDTMRVWSFG